MAVGLPFAEHESVALNGGSIVIFSSGISVIDNCEMQQKADAFWKNFGWWKERQCSWLRDDSGSSRKIVTSLLLVHLNCTDCIATYRVFNALIQTTKSISHS
ncbi:MAG: VOC family protein [Herbaspirillum sp.]